MNIWGILEYTAAVSVIGLLIWLVKFIFHDKLDARWHYFIWLVLLVRLVVPVRFQLISTPFSVFHEIPVWKWVEMGRLLAEKRGYGDFAVTLGWVWLGGAVLLGSFYLVIWAVLRIQIARAPEADGKVKAYVDGIAAKYGLKSCRDIRILKGSTPYICGVVRPVLVLPEKMVMNCGSPEVASRSLYGELPDDSMEVLDGTEKLEGRNVLNRKGKPGDRNTLDSTGKLEGMNALDSSKISGGEEGSGSEGLPEESVIVHELLHRKFGDVLVNIGLHIIRAVNWFNPLVWILTSVVQNDGEALCDQRVLEYCGEENAKNYGELLISMSEGGNRNIVKAGTSNMAGSYRNMKTRIRRIRDFRKVPKGTGFVTLCITLMLALAGISSSAREQEGFSVDPITSQGDLELALLQARCYHARTPEEAVYLFLRAYKEGNTVYRMSVMPEEEVSQYEAFALEWFERRDIWLWAELFDEKNGYPAYFPKEASTAESFRVYNLQYDEKEGSATVCALFRGADGRCFAEWKLALRNEDGWKVWLEDESELVEGEYQPEALVSGSVRIGDFLVEMYGYNEGYFNELETFQGGVVLLFSQGSQESEAEASFPVCFSQEFKYQYGYITYLGEEDLDEARVKVVTTKAENRDNEWVQDQIREEAAVVRVYGDARTPDIGNFNASDYSYGDSEENSVVVFSGKELVTGKPRLVWGGASGHSEPGQCWKKGDRIGVYIRIFVDGILWEEGKVWSEML